MVPGSISAHYKLSPGQVYTGAGKQDKGHRCIL